MKHTSLALSALLLASISLTGCIDQTKDVPNQIYIYTDTPTDGGTTPPPTGGTLPKVVLAGDIAIDTTLTADTAWVIDGLVVVKPGVTLTIEPGTILIGREGTGSNTSYMVVDKGGNIMAEGTADAPIVFTSEIAYDGGTGAWGQWGGLTIIGHAANTQVGPYEVNSAFTADSSDLADNSGVLRYVEILNSGITMAQDKEINGLSLVGVGSGTTIDHITINKSDDDCIEAWGGTVNMSNITLSECSDDHFDIDDGYSGTVTNLVINQTTGNAAIEQSGETVATFDGFTITQNTSAKEGGIYFKKAGIGGHFMNGTVIDNSVDGYGAIHSVEIADIANTSFDNVNLIGNGSDPYFTGDAASSAVELEALFNAGTANYLGVKPKSSLSGDLTTMTLTADTIWVIDGLVTVPSGSTLTIEPGTTIVGKEGTGSNTSYLVVDKDAQIIADGLAEAKITFTSEIAYDGGTAAWGQWGGLTLIGNAANPQVGPYEVNSAFVPGQGVDNDDSGVLRYVDILNSGITMAQDKEINGLSLVGVGSTTIIDHITVNKSDDDCIEAWGGTVDMSNITLSECTDDHFDIDDGYSGTVTNLVINQTTGNAGIEQSGETVATFDGFTITQYKSAKEGGIYFKKAGIGGHFSNGTVIDKSVDGYGAIHSVETADIANTSFSSVTLVGNGSDPYFTGDAASSAVDLQNLFESDASNTLQ